MCENKRLFTQICFCSMLPKNLFLLSHVFCNIEFKFSWFLNTKQSSEILIFKVEMLLEFQNKTNIEITGFLSIHFGFVLELSEIDLRNIDLLDTHLDLLDIDIPSKYFVCLHNVFKTFSRHVFKTSSRHVFKTSWIRPLCSNFSSSKTSSRRFGRRKIVLVKTCWRRFKD